jgi:hypothetical protein
VPINNRGNTNAIYCAYEAPTQTPGISGANRINRATAASRTGLLAEVRRQGSVNLLAAV